MELEPLLDSIGIKWHQDFIRFVQTGDASPEFLTYLDGDPKAQAAVEAAFTDQARALEGLAKLIKTSNFSTATKASPSEGVSIARSFQRIADLTGDEREEAVSVAAKALAHHAAAQPGKAEALKSALSALHDKVGALVP
jgi:hypothetical protein